MALLAGSGALQASCKGVKAADNDDTGFGFTGFCQVSGITSYLATYAWSIVGRRA